MATLSKLPLHGRRVCTTEKMGMVPKGAPGRAFTAESSQGAPHETYLVHFDNEEYNTHTNSPWPGYAQVDWCDSHYGNFLRAGSLEPIGLEIDDDGNLI